MRLVMSGIVGRLQAVTIRHYASKAEKKKGIDRRPVPKLIESTIANRGFLRPTRDYQPPSDIESRLSSILAQHQTDPFKSLESKYLLLSECSSAFGGYSVPNSLLHTINTIDDLRRFYETPVDTKTPFDKLCQQEKPANLHVQKDYVRWHPDNDTLFKGVTAFPKSSTLVTGLKSKTKYRGHNQGTIWNDI